MKSDPKPQLRSALRQRRDLYQKTIDSKACAQAILENLKSAEIVAPGTIIGSYWPVKSEADVRPLLTYFYEQGHVCALPLVEAAKKPLIFRQWQPGNLLVSGIYNILRPDEAAPPAIPTVLFVPVLGFDLQGHRIGYGEGYYDRTLEELRKNNHIIAIGIAFDCQEVSSIPFHDHDQKLDYIITPTRVIEIEK